MQRTIHLFTFCRQLVHTLSTPCPRPVYMCREVLRLHAFGSPPRSRLVLAPIVLAVVPYNTLQYKALSTLSLHTLFESRRRNRPRHRRAGRFSRHSRRRLSEAHPAAVAAAGRYNCNIMKGNRDRSSESTHHVHTCTPGLRSAQPCTSCPRPNPSARAPTRRDTGCSSLWHQLWFLLHTYIQTYIQPICMDPSRGGALSHLLYHDPPPLPRP